MKKYYINKQRDRMEDIPYKGSIPFNGVEYCTSLEQLKNRLRYAKEAVEYWKRMEDKIQINFFRNHLEHINEKIKQLQYHEIN